MTFQQYFIARNWKDSLKFNFSLFPWLRIDTILQKKTTDEEYNIITDYIDNYAQKSVDDESINRGEKLTDKLKTHNNDFELTEELSTFITHSIHENILKILPPLINSLKTKTTVSPLSSDDTTEETFTKVNKNSYSQNYYELNEDHIEKIAETLRNLILNDDEILSKYVDVKIKEFFNKNRVDEEQNGMIDKINNDLNIMRMTIKNYDNEKEDLKNVINLNNQKVHEIIGQMQSHYEMEMKIKIEDILNNLNERFDNLHEKQLKIIKEHLKIYIIELLNIENNPNVNDINLKDYIKNTFITKNYLKDHLSEFNKDINKNLQYEIERSKTIFVEDITNKVKLEILKVIQEKHQNCEIDESKIKKIIEKALELYDADKTGLVDYALESAGGQVLSTRCTENYHIKSAQISIFGIPLWYPSNTPRIAISPTVQPGECWAFQGFPGFLGKLKFLIFKIKIFFIIIYE